MLFWKKNKDVVDLIVKENKRLKSENASLRKKLDKLENLKQQYEELINSVQRLQDEYKKKLIEFEKIENMFQEEIEKMK